MPAAASATAIVHSNLADQGWDQNPDPATVARYWGTPAFPCRAGDDVQITSVTGPDAKGPARMYNGIATFDTTGRRYTSRAGDAVAAQAQISGPNFLAPGLPEHALVGRFGTQPPFLVGDSWSGVASDAGLYLAVNDKRGQFFNNAGDYTVAVQTPVAFPIKSGFTFTPGRNLAATGGYYLVFQADGNLVVYSGEPVWQNAVWAMNREPGLGDAWKRTAYLTLTGNGALLAEDTGRRRVWTSDTTDIPHIWCQLELDEKGTLRIVRRSPNGTATEYWKRP